METQFVFCVRKCFVINYVIVSLVLNVILGFIVQVFILKCTHSLFIFRNIFIFLLKLKTYSVCVCSCVCIRVCMYVIW